MPVVLFHAATGTAPHAAPLPAFSGPDRREAPVPQPPRDRPPEPSEQPPAPPSEVPDGPPDETPPQGPPETPDDTPDRELPQGSFGRETGGCAVGDPGVRTATVQQVFA